MRAGFTLLELMVTLTLIGVTVGLVAVGGRAPATPAQAQGDVIRRARHRAVSTGAPVSVLADSAGQFAAYPDGLIVGAPGAPTAFGGTR